MTPGQRIKAHRERRGLTQAGLAARLYVDQSMVSRWEADLTTPTRAAQHILAGFFEVDAADLFATEVAS
jgi:transcriptional regulator with XRE-family HTH domain